MPASMDVATLRAQLPSGWVRTADELAARSAGAGHERRVSSGLAGVDALLAGGFAAGRLTSCVAAGSSGRFTLVLAVLAAATAAEETAALVDLGDHLDPEGAEHAGVRLERLLWVRPRTLADALVATETIAAAGFSLVVLDLGLAPVAARGIGDAAWIRLARAARAHGTALVLSSPGRAGTIAAATVLGIEREQVEWWHGGEPGALLAGLATRASVRKDRGAAPGRSHVHTLVLPDRILPPARARRESRRAAS